MPAKPDRIGKQDKNSKQDKATRAEKEQFVMGLKTQIFCAMLEDIVADTALQVHREIARSGAICDVCGTRCNAVHIPGSSKQPQLAINSRAATPLPDGKATNGSTPGPSTPSSTKDGNVYLDCVNCTRPFASNRYAAHLSSCLGLSTARRGPNRSAAKSKNSDPGRSNSPASELGNISDDSTSKGKMKGSKKNETDLKRKRPISPQVSPNKKQKPKPLTSPFNRSLKAESGGFTSLVPSKLRDSSTAPYPGSTASSSRSSSADAEPLASKFTTSPNFKSKGREGDLSPLKRPSPPRLPPPVTAFHLPEEHDEGEETGSSTDTEGD